MSQEKYTFDDWKAGNIRKSYENNEIEGFDDQHLVGIGYLPEQLNEQGFITDKEYSKIEKAQKETFTKAVEYAYKTFLNEFKERLENAYKPAELIKNRIERLQSEIDDASNYTRDQIYAGEWSKVGIGHKSYAIANNPEELGIAYLHNTIQTPAHNTRTVNHVFVKTVSLRQKEDLESLLESEYSERPDDIKKKLNRDDIFKKASSLKENGMNVNPMFEEIKKWLIDDLGFTEEEIKKRYNISLNNPQSFNRVVNKNTSYHK